MNQLYFCQHFSNIIPMQSVPHPTWQLGLTSRLWHSPCLVASELSLGFSLPLAGITFSKLAGPNRGWDPLVAMDCGLTWPVGISVVFFSSHWQSPLHSPNGRQMPLGLCKETVKESIGHQYFPAGRPLHYSHPLSAGMREPIWSHTLSSSKPSTELVTQKQP